MIGQSTQFDSNTAFVQVRQEIHGLMSFDGADDRDDVIYTVNKLNAVLRAVYDNYQSWSDKFIREFVLSQHDPLKNINSKSDELSHIVRKIQQEIIVRFS